ncbi:MAG: aminodeoxychorismate synthase component I [Deltaproteobacteria bacterium]|jgi:para-aminobenzoate synthetase component 1|nr:aminodeoxychorismate synthase component I [Deltaproteobacteria bacterium]
MESLSPDLIQREMNRLGLDGQKFLFAVNFELTEGFIIENPENQTEILYEIWGRGNKKPLNKPLADNFYLTSKPMSQREYADLFQVVKDGLARGDSYLTNLTIATDIECPLSLEEIFQLSNSPYQLYVPDRFVCFSPERFVQIDSGRISTCPMKGTINAEIDEAEKVILADFKESAEHATIVDLLRNDLSLSAMEVRVSRYRYIDRIKTRQREILQVSSEITGRLPDDYPANIGDIIFRMLPCGSCSGAPKESTLDIIRRAEAKPRGYYTGVYGYFDGHNFDSGVLIRFIENNGGQMVFRSGGGITAYSSMESEYIEAIEKIYLPFV